MAASDYDKWAGGWLVVATSRYDGHKRTDEDQVVNTIQPERSRRRHYGLDGHASLVIRNTYSNWYAMPSLDNRVCSNTQTIRLATRANLLDLDARGEPCGTVV